MEVRMANECGFYRKKNSNCMNGNPEPDYPVNANNCRTGEGTFQDIDKAIYWYEKSAVQGTVKAMEKLAGIYRHGYWHIPANQVLSDEWAPKAILARKRGI